MIIVEQKNSKYSKECFNCGESFEQLFSISLREALRDGAISRGIKLDEDEVKLGEELYHKKKDLILQSGDAVLIDMIDKLPPEVFGRLKKNYELKIKIIINHHKD